LDRRIGPEIVAGTTRLACIGFASTTSAIGRVRCLRICALAVAVAAVVGHGWSSQTSVLKTSLMNWRGDSAPIANHTVLFIVTSSMKSRAATIIVLAFVSAPFAFGGADRGANPSTAISDEPPRFDFAIESAYLFGAFNPPRNYEISADF